MNIRKKTDYSALYLALDNAMTANLPQMELYCAIGKTVSLRTEKGAAVAAAEYLTEHYPDTRGFSPRNVRRMRDFYRTYENSPKAMNAAMKIGWTQNVVIMEADLTMKQREWYLKAAKQFGWSKAELFANIGSNAHENIVCPVEDDVNYAVESERISDKCDVKRIPRLEYNFGNLLQRYSFYRRKGRRRWASMLCQRNTEERIGFMQS